MTLHLVIKTGTGGQPSNNPQTPAPQPTPTAASSGLSGNGFSTLFLLLKNCTIKGQSQPSLGMGLPGLANLGMGSANFMEMQQQLQSNFMNNPEFMREVKRP